MRSNDNANAKAIATGGVFAAMAVVIMCLGGALHIATYVCPLLCAIILQIVLKSCGARIAWAWYVAVSLLSLLLGPDKEAAAVFLFIGYYPILKPRIDRLPLKWLWKGLLFNAAILLMYWLLINVMGLTQVTEGFGELGTWGAVILLILGNVVFFLLDILLGKRSYGRKK